MVFHFLEDHIQKVMIDKLNGITQRLYLPDMNFHLTDIEMCKCKRHHMS